MRNSGAQAGDALVLTKGLGIGIFAAALKRGELSAAGYAAMIASATRLNAIGRDLPALPGVHAVTDVTGFGLLGHALEMCRGAQLSAVLDLGAIPMLDGAAELARAGIGTGAADRNWDSYGSSVALGDTPDWARGVLCDPQTSGGLLIAVRRSEADGVLRLAREAGFGGHGDRG